MKSRLRNEQGRQFYAFFNTETMHQKGIAAPSKRNLGSFG